MCRSVPQEASQAAWPEGVIARYLTLAGATVDITILTNGREFRQEAEARCTGANCRASKIEGCRIWEEFGDKFGPEPLPFERAGQGAARYLDRWAQSHAEKCRAMPRPEGR